MIHSIIKKFFSLCIEHRIPGNLEFFTLEKYLCLTILYLNNLEGGLVLIIWVATLYVFVNKYFHMWILTLETFYHQTIWICATSKASIRIFHLATCNPCVMKVVVLTFYFDRKCVGYHKGNMKISISWLLFARSFFGHKQPKLLRKDCYITISHKYLLNNIFLKCCSRKMSHCFFFLVTQANILKIVSSYFNINSYFIMFNLKYMFMMFEVLIH